MRTRNGQVGSLLGIDAPAQCFPDSVLEYKKRHQVGRFAPTSRTPPPVADVDIPVGARCEVESAEEGLHKRGTVRFVGQAIFAKTGVWVGIEYDEPIGRNDGSCVFLFLQ